MSIPLLQDVVSLYDNKTKHGLILLLKREPDLKEQLINSTPFLDKDSTISTRLYCYMYDIKNKPICLCGKQKKFLKLNRGFYITCGDSKCLKRSRSLRTSEQNKHKDWKKINEKTKNTCIKKYGAISCFDKKSSNHEQYLKTMIEKYGYDKALKNPEILNKQKETTLKRYGTLNMFSLEKVKNTIMNKYGYDHPLKNPDIAKQTGIKSAESKNKYFLSRVKEMDLEILSKDTYFYKMKCLICGEILNNVSRQNVNFRYRRNESPCNTCFPNIISFRSNQGVDLALALGKFYDKEIQLNRKYIAGMEVDMIIPEFKLGIEFNGLYWHSELHKDPLYHKNKKIKIEKEGYRLIQIWEDDWNDPLKMNIILSRIKNILKKSPKSIYARKCEIKDVSFKDSKEFLENNHLKGNANSSIRYGLYYNDELIFICTFGKSRNSIGGKNKGYELIRSCSKIDTNVVGGFSRLIKYFLNNHDQFKNKLYSFVDCDWSPSVNSLYEKLGFNLVNHTHPGYTWVVHGKREHRVNFQKHKLIKEGYDKNKTEREIMTEDLNSYRIWDSGNLKYELIII